MGRAAGLLQPIGVVFLNGAAAFLVLEKASGQVKRVIGGVVQPTPMLDMAVNSNSGRGLLRHGAAPRIPAPRPYGDRPLDGQQSGRRHRRRVRRAAARHPGRPVRRGARGRGGWCSIATSPCCGHAETDNVVVAGHPGTNNANEARQPQR